MRIARARLTFADGSTPNLKRLPSRERIELAEFYGVRTDSEFVRKEPDEMRTENTQEAHGKRFAACPPQPQPQPQPQPNDERRSITASVAVAELRSESAVVEPPRTKPATPTGPVAVPRKPMEPDRPPGRGERLAGMLHGYLAMSGTPYHRPATKPPDTAIAAKCLAACGNADMADVAGYLRELFQSGKSPRHEAGPKGYAWFPPVLASQFGDPGVPVIRPEPNPPTAAELAELEVRMAAEGLRVDPTGRVVPLPPSEARAHA